MPVISFPPHISPRSDGHNKVGQFNWFKRSDYHFLGDKYCTWISTSNWWSSWTTGAKYGNFACTADRDFDSIRCKECDGRVKEIVGTGIQACQTSPSVSQFCHLANCLKRKNNRCRADLATSLHCTPSVFLHTIASIYSSRRLPLSLPYTLLLNTAGCYSDRQEEGYWTIWGRTPRVVIITLVQMSHHVSQRTGRRKRLFPLLGNINQCPFTTHQVNIRNVEYLMPACQMPSTLPGRTEYRDRGGKRHTLTQSKGLQQVGDV